MELLLLSDPRAREGATLAAVFCKLEGVKWESAYRGSRSHKIVPVLLYNATDGIGNSWQATLCGQFVIHVIRANKSLCLCMKSIHQPANQCTLPIPVQQHNTAYHSNIKDDTPQCEQQHLVHGALNHAQLAASFFLLCHTLFYGHSKLHLKIGAVFVWLKLAIHWQLHFGILT